MTDDLIQLIVAAHRHMIAAPLPGISVERPDAAGAPSPAASKSAPLGSLPVPPASATPTGYPPRDDVGDALDWIAYTARFADLPGELVDRIVDAYRASPAYATRCDDEANDDWLPRITATCATCGDTWSGDDGNAAADYIDGHKSAGCDQLDPADPATAPPRHAVTKADQ